MFLFRSKSNKLATKSSILVVTRFLYPPLDLPHFSTMEVRLNRCLAKCHLERLLRKTINCSILHGFALLMPTLAHWPEEPRNYHVLRALILPVKSSSFMIIIPQFDYFTLYFSFISLFMIIFAIILAKKTDIELKYRQKSSYFVILWIIFVANLDFFWLNRSMVPTPNTMSGVPCNDITRGKFRIRKTSAFQIH